VSHGRDRARLTVSFAGRRECGHRRGTSEWKPSWLCSAHPCTVAPAADVHSTVLLRGESGTGQEMIAHAIPRLSPRNKGPFIRVNCAALSGILRQSELFGHEKGAFAGAALARAGPFELTHGGTPFLDEIGEISPAFPMQRPPVPQEREFERAATNRNLGVAATQGEYRADLYFRIYVISILLPPLRERPEDIPPLAGHLP
jgi:Nif-specific regulatory protein